MPTRELDEAFRQAGRRIVAALAARYRDLDIAEEAFAESCLRATTAWRAAGPPRDPAAWLYRVAQHAAIDLIRRRKTRAGFRPEPEPHEATAEDRLTEDSAVIPDERLRLIFICCHPAVAPDSRAALTLRLVCGLETAEIAHAFLLNEATLAQRLVRAKRKIAEAGVSFEVPGPELWPERLAAVLSTVEVAYAKAHEDAAGTGRHRDFGPEMLDMTALLAEMLPKEAEVQALAATVRFAEARRPARLAEDGTMIPLSEQDPARWSQPLILDARRYCARALTLGGPGPRVLQMLIHALWCGRKSLAEAAPWKAVLAAYDLLLGFRDDPVVRINRAVALGEVEGPAAALAEVDRLDGMVLGRFLPYQALRGDLLARLGDVQAARTAFDAALALSPGEAESRYLRRQRDASMRAESGPG